VIDSFHWTDDAKKIASTGWNDMQVRITPDFRVYTHLHIKPEKAVLYARTDKSKFGTTYNLNLID
jgi:hypothetical protein